MQGDLGLEGFVLGLHLVLLDLGRVRGLGLGGLLRLGLLDGGVHGHSQLYSLASLIMAWVRALIAGTGSLRSSSCACASVMPLVCP